MSAPLQPEELRRYARHLSLPEVGVEGQRRLRAASVLCVGAGGLGSPAALYLAAAGVGCLGIADSDVVDESNLQRQILHGTPEVGQSKVESAVRRLRSLNPHVEIRGIRVRLRSENALEILRPFDVVIDGTDNFAARFLVNDACVFLRKPNVYGAVHRFEGQGSVFAPHLGAPCYRCLYPEPPPPGAAPSCAEAGVLGVVPGLIGTLQAAETLKLILGVGQPLLGRLLLLDALAMRWREMRIERDPGCPVCGQQPSITRLADLDSACGVGGAVGATDEVDVHELKRVLDARDPRVVVLDVREPHEYQVARIPGAQLFPLSTLTQRFQELDPGRCYYIHCRSGVRSMRAVHFLREQGFGQLKNVRGGIQAWSREIDPSVPMT